MPPKVLVEDPLRGLASELLSCELFPQKYDFETVCSCEECIPKIKFLKEFERFLMSKYRLVLELMKRREKVVEQCFTFVDACDWSERALDGFLNNLKEVFDELGEEFTEGGRGLQHKTEMMKLYKTLAQSGLFPNYDVPDEELVNKTTTRLAKYIDFNIGSRGMFYYKRTKFWDEGEYLLNKILEIEAEYQDAKKAAADNGKRLHPSRTKGFILQQIECLENLPVKGLRIEAKACIAKFFDNNPIKDYVFHAKTLINLTSMDMVDARKAFWRKNKVQGKGGHDLTRLSTTLDILIKKAEAFYAEWENRFAQYIPPPTLQPRDN